MKAFGTSTKFILLALIIASFGVFAIGCGGSDDNKDVSAQTSQEIQEQADVANQQTDLSGKSKCDSGIYAGANTSCAFAVNVASEYKQSGGASSITVHSPTTGGDYTMTCGPDALGTVCRGGDNASVYITN